MTAKSLCLTCPECSWSAEMSELPGDAALDQARGALADHLSEEHAYAREEATALARRVAWKPRGRGSS